MCEKETAGNVPERPRRGSARAVTDEAAKHAEDVNNMYTEMPEHASKKAQGE